MPREALGPPMVLPLDEDLAEGGHRASAWLMVRLLQALAPYIKPDAPAELVSNLVADVEHC